VLTPGWLLAALGALKRVPPWLWSVLAILAAAALVLGLSECHARNAAAGAVKLDRATSDAATGNLVIAADRKAANNQSARDAAFRNQQQQQEDKIDEAARNGTSPLDALFNQLR